MSSLSFKLVFAEETRKTRPDDGLATFPWLVRKSQHLFPQIGSAVPKYLYLDDESDWITISSEEDLREAIIYANGASLSSLKLTIQPGKNNIRPHTGIYCDGCNAPIGFQNRFKCLNCPDFDFCSKCESSDKIRATHDSSHLFMRMRTPILLPGQTTICSEVCEKITTSSNIHPGIICDGCDRDIAGIRYKCASCCDYDLCGACIQSCTFYHPENHPFIKIRSPTALKLGGTALLREVRRDIFVPNNLTVDVKLKNFGGCARRRMRHAQNGCPGHRCRAKAAQAQNQVQPQDQDQAQVQPQAQYRPDPQETPNTRVLFPESQIPLPSYSESTLEVPSSKSAPESNVDAPAETEQASTSFEGSSPKTELEVSNTESETATESLQPPQPEEPYAQQLSALDSMGFEDRDECLRLLKLHKGSLELTVNQLLRF